jgi:hypothetical protein
VAGSWQVKYDGVCARCGAALHAGEVAIYERSTHSMRCVQCPTQPSSSDALEVDAGIAGASARREFHHRTANREARVHARFGRRLGGVLLAITDDPQSTRAWVRGATGEEMLGRALEGLPGIRLLHDRKAPSTRGNIDHIAIAAPGVFVIDAKRYAGRVEIRNRGNIFRPDRRLYVGRRDCSAAADGLGWQIDAVIDALQSARIAPPPQVTPVLCFVDSEWPLIARPTSFRGVLLEDPRSLRKRLSATGPLVPNAIDGLTRILAEALPAK